MSFNSDTETYICLSERFYLLIKLFFKNLSILKISKNYGLLLLQIATRFSKWGKHVAKKTVVPFKGCRSSEHGLLYIHTPSIWCTLQCIISCIRREIFFLSPNTLSFMIFQESICAKLGGTMKVSEIQWNVFVNFITQSMTKMFYLLTIGVKTIIG